MEGIIHSMTPQERSKPEIIKAVRKRRIAAGAGVPGTGCQPAVIPVRANAIDDEKNERRRNDENDAWLERNDAGYALSDFKGWRTSFKSINWRLYH